MGLPRANSVGFHVQCRVCLGTDLVGEGTVVRCYDCGAPHVIRLVPTLVSADVDQFMYYRIRAKKKLGARGGS